jgi:hypothetical protein
MTPQMQARWCRDTRAAVAQMTDKELAVTLADSEQYSATSPTYRAVNRMAKHEAGVVRGWWLVITLGAVDKATPTLGYAMEALAGFDAGAGQAPAVEPSVEGNSQ